MNAEMGRPEMVRLHVFCSSAAGSGNPLAILSGVCNELRRLADETLVAEALNQVVLLSEGSPASMRIFTPTTELAFSGQPVLGALHLLRRQGRPMLIETGVGQVRGQYTDGLDWLEARPEWSPPMQIDQLHDPAAVEALTGAPDGVGYYYPWAWIDEAAGHMRTRMFAPGLGIAEGQASGAAVVRLAAEVNRDLIVRQGRDSMLHARLTGNGTVWLGGRCVLASGEQDQS